MPGSGKSTLGKAMAKMLNYTFIDLDDRIVQAEGMPIKDIFAQKGEAYFRELESKVLKDTVSEDHIVVATGGGTPCFFNNMEVMNQMGVSIFLNIPLEKLIHRLSSNKAQLQVRPLFAGKNKGEIMQTLQEMWQKRSPFYMKASLTIPYKEAKPEMILQYIENKKAY